MMPTGNITYTNDTIQTNRMDKIKVFLFDKPLNTNTNDTTQTNRMDNIKVYLFDKLLML